MKLIIILFFVFLLCDHASPQSEFVSSFCIEKSGLYATNGSYDNNLSLLLLNLTSAASVRGFYNASAGEGSDKVYGIFYCRGDLKSDDCHDCVQTAKLRIRDECSNNKEAIIFYDKCTLRYANRSIFSLEEEVPNDWSYSATLVSDKEQFNKELTAAMDGPMDQAAFNASLGGFAVGQTNLGANQTLYCLAQCTPDILGSPCHKCLAAALDNLVDEGKTRMSLFMPSCQVMYSLNIPSFNAGRVPISSPFSPSADSPAGSPSSQVPSLSPPSKVPSASSKKSKLKIVVGVILFAALGLTLFLSGVWFCFHQRNPSEEYTDHPSELRQNMPLCPQEIPRTPTPPSTSSSLESEKTNNQRSLGIPRAFSKITFTYQELAVATDNFSRANLLGQGGFGYVHKGKLSSGKEIAVKQLKTGSSQGEREFKAEVETVSRVHHRHLVSLIGYCISEDQRMLVYEYVPNKTLDFHLHGGGRPTMSWERRWKIALGAAKGLAYLHEDCQPKIIHRDIKAANILLDNNFEAKVADFGLAKFSLDTDTHVSTRVVGTFGYLDPEYASSGKLTEKSDVFSYGVVLIELITGHRPYDVAESFMEAGLVQWARPLLTEALETGSFTLLVDPRLEEYDASEMAQMVACATTCVSSSARQRPKMSQVARVLGGNLSADGLLKEIGSVSDNRTFPGSSDYDSSPESQYNHDLNQLRTPDLVSQGDCSTESSSLFASAQGLPPPTSSTAKST